MKRALLIFCLLFSSLGSTGYTAEPSFQTVEISALYTPGADPYSVLSDEEPIEQYECLPPIGVPIQTPCYRYLLFEYQQQVTTLWHAHQIRFINFTARNTLSFSSWAHSWSRSGLETFDPSSLYS